MERKAAQRESIYRWLQTTNEGDSIQPSASPTSYQPQNVEDLINDNPPSNLASRLNSNPIIQHLVTQYKDQAADLKQDYSASKNNLIQDTSSRSAPYGCQKPKLEPSKPFQRRARRKTREDRYVLKEQAVNAVNQTTPVKAHGRSLRRRRRKEASGTALLHRFVADNVASKRLTVSVSFPNFTLIISLKFFDVAFQCPLGSCSTLDQLQGLY
jgi:hypothetical protein